jgi:hypothetical protein
MEVRDGDSTNTSRAFLSFIFTAAALADQLSPSLLNANKPRRLRDIRFSPAGTKSLPKPKKRDSVATYKGFAETFAKKYPFLTVQRAAEITGGDASHRQEVEKNCRFLRR